MVSERSDYPRNTAKDRLESDERAANLAKILTENTKSLNRERVANGIQPVEYLESLHPQQPELNRWSDTEAIGWVIKHFQLGIDFTQDSNREYTDEQLGLLLAAIPRMNASHQHAVYKFHVVDGEGAPSDQLDDRSGHMMHTGRLILGTDHSDATGLTHSTRLLQANAPYALAGEQGLQLAMDVLDRYVILHQRSSDEALEKRELLDRTLPQDPVIFFDGTKTSQMTSFFTKNGEIFQVPK